MDDQAFPDQGPAYGPPQPMVKTTTGRLVPHSQVYGPSGFDSPNAGDPASGAGNLGAALFGGSKD